MEKEKRQQDRRVNVTVTHRYETDRLGYFVRNFFHIVSMLGVCFCIVMIVLVILGIA